MKKPKRFISMILLTVTLISAMSVGASAADYSFNAVGTPDYYDSTSYEEVYGSRYNYGGANVVDYQLPEIPYGSISTTQTGVMEKVRLPGLQQYVSVSTGSGGYGVEAGNYGTPVISGGTVTTPVYREPAYTSAEDMERKDGSIGTLKIPSLDINMKVWEGETNASMAKGLGHYSSSSAWDGNVCLCGHNRGAKYVIGDIKDLEIGDTITYTTIYGTRTYEVVLVKTISSNDWSYLQATSDNRITITTCLANRPEKRICVQAVQI
ncbi:Sortase (surface protein transpeptidase) [uncultured Flavonifractor sp.]|nr:sortase family protein%2C LPXTG-site transpeptidase [Flavonifractor plautii]SCJ47406.1 Sortase (surface protein transpeptidase) [uncultured Flavonifractor sp.]